MKIHANSYFIGFAVGLLPMLAKDIPSKGSAENKCQQEIKDSFALTNKDFGKIEKSVEKGTITWTQALDSLKTNKKIQEAFSKGFAKGINSAKNAARVCK